MCIRDSGQPPDGEGPDGKCAHRKGTDGQGADAAGAQMPGFAEAVGQAEIDHLTIGTLEIEHIVPPPLSSLTPGWLRRR